MNFYVYSILDPRKPGTYKYGELEFLYEPIYIGKGKGNRLKEHLHSNRLKKNDFKNYKIKNILKENVRPIIIKLKESLVEQDAFAIEKEYISKIGRYPKGPLTNITDGGEGIAGLKHTQESLEKMSKTWFNKETASWNKGLTMSEEHCKKQSESHFGRTLTVETKNKLSLIRKGISKSNKHKQKIKETLCKKIYKFISPNKEEFIVRNYNQFAKDRNLSAGNICSLLQGKFKQYKGWTAEIIGM